MKRFFFGLFILSGIVSFAQDYTCKEDLFPVLDKGKKQYGYVNIFGELRIAAFYDQARPFSEGIAVVSRKSKFGIINCDAKVILTCDYDQIQDFENGYAWVQKGELWGMIDKSGKFILECKYQQVENISKFNDLAWLKTEGKWGVFNKETRQFVHEAQFDEYLQLSHDFSLVEIDGKKGMINHLETVKTLEVQYDSIIKFAPYLMAYYKGGKLGVIRDNARPILSLEYDEVKNLGETLFAVKSMGKYAVYNVWGRTIVPNVLDSIASFSSDAALYKLDGKYSFINSKGQKFNADYEYANSFKNGLALVKDKSFFLINRRGEIVSDRYDDIVLYQDYYASKSNENWTIHTFSAPKSVSLEFDEVLGGFTNKIRVRTKEGLRFYNALSGNYYSADVYDFVADWEGSFAVYTKNGLLGVLDSLCNVVIKAEFSAINQEYAFGKLYFRGINSQGVFLFDEKGKMFLAAKQAIEIISPTKLIVVKGSKWGIYDTKKLVYSIDFKYDGLQFGEKKNPVFAESVIFIQKGKRGLCSMEGQILLKPKFANARYLGEGYFMFSSKGKQTVVNQKGEVLLTAMPFDFEKYYATGIYCVHKNSKYALVDKLGVLKTDYLFDEVLGFYGQYSVVRSGDKYGIVGKSGKLKYDIRFTKLQKTKEGYILLNKKEKIALDFTGDLH